MGRFVVTDEHLIRRGFFGGGALRCFAATRVVKASKKKRRAFIIFAAPGLMCFQMASALQLISYRTACVGELQCALVAS
jgi:hypothetical protein